MKAGKMRHIVNVMRPASPQGEDMRNSPPKQLIGNVPCSIETLSGREAERLQQMYATATLKVGMYGDPAKPIKAVDKLEFGTRTLNILHINDKNQNGVELELICGEEIA